ncbi:helix-turn-helix domain-containing protein [Sphaerisporangium album]|nr:helix-turn-helix transcriptional regulator [Sphaerisporangium album]
MSPAPRPVDPSASPLHLLGVGLRRCREQCGLTLEAVGAQVSVDWSHLARWERGERHPPEDVVARLDEVYGAGGFLVALQAMTNTSGRPVRDQAPQWDGERMDVLRRRLIGGVAAMGVAAVAGMPALDGISNLRGVVDSALGNRPHVEDWEETAWEYAYAVLAPSIMGVVRDLSADVLGFQEAMTSASGKEVSRWLRVNAQLSTLLAFALGSIGQQRESHHWWRVAARAAEQTGEGELLAAVYGHEAVQALHEGRPLPLVVSRATRAIELTKGRACRAASAAYGARAHARVLLGDLAGALADLDEQASLFERMPAEVVADAQSVNGWPQTRVLYCRSLVYTFGGHPDAAQMQMEAITAYPGWQTRQKAQVELHQAYTEVRSGHIESGVEHARSVLDTLPDDHVNRFVIHNAAAVAAAVPAVERSRPPVIEYREMLALSRRLDAPHH